MGLETDTASSPAPTPAPHFIDGLLDQDEPPKQKRRPKALDPEARDRAAKRAQVTRVVKRMKAAKSEAELKDRMAEYLGRPAPAKPAPPVTVGEVLPESMPGVVVDPVEGFWKMVQAVADGSRFAVTDQQVNGLTQGTKPCAEKYLASHMTVETLAAVTILSVFGKPLIEFAFEQLDKQRQKKAGAPGHPSSDPNSKAAAPPADARSAA